MFVSFVFQLHKRPDVPLYKKIRSSEFHLSYFLILIACIFFLPFPESLDFNSEMHSFL